MNEEHLARIANTPFKDLIETKYECHVAQFMLQLGHDPGLVYNYVKSIVSRRYRAFYNTEKRFGRYLEGNNNDTHYDNDSEDRPSEMREIEERVPYLDTVESRNKPKLQVSEKRLIQMAKNYETPVADDVSQKTIYSLSRDKKRKIECMDNGNNNNNNNNGENHVTKKIKTEPIRAEDLSKKLEEFTLDAKQVVNGKSRRYDGSRSSEAHLVTEIGLFLVEFLLRPCDFNIAMETGPVDTNRKSYVINLKSNAFLCFDPELLDKQQQLQDYLSRIVTNSEKLFGRESDVDLISRKMFINFKRNDVVTKLIDGYFFTICYIKAVLSLLVGTGQDGDPDVDKLKYKVNEWLYQVTVYIVVIACIWNDISLDGFVQYRTENPRVFETQYDQFTFVAGPLKEKILHLACWLSTRNYKYTEEGFIAIMLEHCKIYAGLMVELWGYNYTELLLIEEELEKRVN